MPTTTTQERILPPLVIDLGKTRRKRIKRLKRGRGKLAREVQQVVAEVSASLGDEAHDKEIIPVVVIYRRKRKKRRGLSLPFMV